MYINWYDAQQDSIERIKRAHDERQHDRLVRQAKLARRSQHQPFLRLIRDLRSLVRRSPRAIQSPRQRSKQVLS